jgi:hypothetical protein
MSGSPPGKSRPAAAGSDFRAKRFRLLPFVGRRDPKIEIKENADPFKPTFEAAASWLIFCVALSLRIDLDMLFFGYEKATVRIPAETFA